MELQLGAVGGNPLKQQQPWTLFNDTFLQSACLRSNDSDTAASNNQTYRFLEAGPQSSSTWECSTYMAQEAGFDMDITTVTTPLASEPPLPREMTFNDDSLVSVIAYSVLFFLAAFGNLTVFITLFRNRHRKSRVNMFIMHLSMADMIVTFVMLPLEVAWHVTVAWRAGDAGCRILMFWRAFGFYLSSFILITISLDRYFAITHPLSLSDADKRGKLMLLFAWLFSFFASIPQSVIFHVEKHPHYPWFTQCVTFNFFPTPDHELAYNLFNMVALYGAPLTVIVIAYSLILWEISKKSRESKEQVVRRMDGGMSTRTFRRSGIGRIEKARIRTLKMTIVIVLVFLACWTPYFVISAWWWIDKDSAKLINPKIQRGLFIFAVSNSCVNPIVYGMFTNTFAREFKRCCWSKLFGKSEPLSNNSSSTSKVQHVLLAKQRELQAKAAKIDDAAAREHVPPTITSQAPSREESTVTTCNIPITPDTDIPIFTKFSIARQVTPPHIAQGRGNTYTLDKYLLL